MKLRIFGKGFPWVLQTATRTPYFVSTGFVCLEEVHAKVLEKELRQGVEELSKEHKRLTEPVEGMGGFGISFTPGKRDEFVPEKGTISINMEYVFQPLIFRGYVSFQGSRFWIGALVILSGRFKAGDLFFGGESEKGLFGKVFKVLFFCSGSMFWYSPNKGKLLSNFLRPFDGILFKRNFQRALQQLLSIFLMRGQPACRMQAINEVSAGPWSTSMVNMDPLGLQISMSISVESFRQKNDPLVTTLGLSHHVD